MFRGPVRVQCWPWSTRFATREVSHLILMNPAPVSASDVAVLRRAYLEKPGADMDRQKQIVASAAYQAGDPEAVTVLFFVTAPCA